MHPIPTMPMAASLPEWLTAIGGVGAFLATARLAYLAKQQIDAGQTQAASEAAAIDKQIGASVEQGKAIRETARAQLQPMVFAHGDATHTGPEKDYLIDQGQVGFGYKLANEGTGLALNILHGVEIGGQRFEWSDGMRWRALRPGDWYPAQDFLDEGNVIRIRPFVVVRDERKLPDDWATLPRHYWAEFDNVFGERFRTRNPSDPQEAAEFDRIDDSK